MPNSREDATEAAEPRIMKCVSSLNDAIQRRIDSHYRDGDEIIISDVTGNSSVYDCFYSMTGSAYARKEEMDEAILRVCDVLERTGWQTDIRYPLSFWRKRPKTNRPRLVIW